MGLRAGEGGGDAFPESRVSGYPQLFVDVLLAGDVGPHVLIFLVLLLLRR